MRRDWVNVSSKGSIAGVTGSSVVGGEIVGEELITVGVAEEPQALKAAVINITKKTHVKRSREMLFIIAST